MQTADRTAIPRSEATTRNLLSLVRSRNGPRECGSVAVFAMGDPLRRFPFTDVGFLRLEMLPRSLPAGCARSDAHSVREPKSRGSGRKLPRISSERGTCTGFRLACCTAKQEERTLKEPRNASSRAESLVLSKIELSRNLRSDASLIKSTAFLTSHFRV